MFVVKSIHIQIMVRLWIYQVVRFLIEENWFMHHLLTTPDAGGNNSILYGVSHH